MFLSSSKQNKTKHSVSVFFHKKDPEGCTLHLKVPQHGAMTSCQNENDRKEKRETHARTHSRDIADSFHKSSIGGGMGTVGDFSF